MIQLVPRSEHTAWLLVGYRNKYINMLLREINGIFPEIHTEHIDGHNLSVMQSVQVVCIVTTVI